MIKLFDNDALETTDMTKSYGLGVLSNARSCTVAEELNGAFDLDLEYPVDGKHADAIDLDMILFCKARPSDRVGNPFRIYRIGQVINGAIQISAHHAFYDLNAAVMLPTQRTGIRGAVTGLNNDRLGADRIRVWYSGITDTETEFVIDTPRSLAQALAGADGSLQSVFGGELEYEYDGSRKIVIATLHDRRGRDLPYTIQYGVNMTGFRREADIDNTYTAVYAHYSKDNQFRSALVPTGSTGLHDKYFVLDLTSCFEQLPAVRLLQAETQKYIAKNKIGDPAVSIETSFFGARANVYGLSDKDIELGDSLQVSFPRFGVSTTERAVKSVYNVLTDRYNTLTVGEIEKNAADTLAELEKDITNPHIF